MTAGRELRPAPKKLCHRHNFRVKILDMDRIKIYDINKSRKEG